MAIDVDIALAATTDRQRVVAQALREANGVSASDDPGAAWWVRLAKAALQALDEENAERPGPVHSGPQPPVQISHEWGSQLITTPSAEQQIRMDAARITVGLFHEVDTTDLGENDIVDAFLTQAAKVAAFMRDGVGV